MKKSIKIPKKVQLPKIKRIFDLIVSFFLFIIAIPFLIFILLWILFEQIFIPSSRGSVLYKEIRVSQGKKFNFYKFRIFKIHVLKKQKGKKCIHTKPLEKNKKNLTYYGRFLKQIYMDELPQLFNIIKGDMTLVGPRPTNIENTEIMKQEKNFNNFIMKCGLTGPFQSKKGKTSDNNQTRLDKTYIKFINENNSLSILLKDIKILLKTIKIIIEAKGI